MRILARTIGQICLGIIDLLSVLKEGRSMRPSFRSICYSATKIGMMAMGYRP